MQAKKRYAFEIMQEGTAGIIFRMEGGIKKVLAMRESAFASFVLAGARTEGSLFLVRVSFETDRKPVQMRIIEK